jgi:AAA ATPase domain
VLVERDRELAALDALLDRGGALVIEGGAGIGKTALAVAAAAAARQRGWRVLRSCGSELESGFAFGVVRQLLERMLAEASPEQRAVLLAGPAHSVAGLLAGPPGPAGEFAAQDASFAIRHGLYWLIVHLAAGQPVLIIVDDAHWADEPSLRWLAYLATRLDGLRAALLVALRPAEAASRAAPLQAVREAAAAVRPAVLSGDGVAVLARAALGEGVPGDQCAALRAASGGNPFYLSELLRATLAAPAAPQTSPATAPAASAASAAAVSPVAPTAAPVVSSAPVAAVESAVPATSSDPVDPAGQVGEADPAGPAAAPAAAAGPRVRLWSGMSRRGSGGWTPGRRPWPRRSPCSGTAAGCGTPPPWPGWICRLPSGWRPTWSGSRCWPPPTRPGSCTRSCATRSRPPRPATSATPRTGARPASLTGTARRPGRWPRI